MRALALVLALGACGRLDFEARSADVTGDGAPGDVATDTASNFAYVFPDQCPTTAPTADPMIWAVTTTRLQGGGLAANAEVSISRAFGGPAVATVTTDANGTGTLTIPTGGTAFPTYITVGGAGYVTGVGYATRAFRASEAQNFNVGTAADFAATYAARGLTQAANTATIFVGILRCDNAFVPDITIGSTPAVPLIYASNDGTPEPGRTMTSQVSYAALLDVPFGRVTLVTAGASIAPLEIEVSAAYPVVYVNLFADTASL